MKLKEALKLAIDPIIVLTVTSNLGMIEEFVTNSKKINTLYSLNHFRTNTPKDSRVNVLFDKDQKYLNANVVGLDRDFFYLSVLGNERIYHLNIIIYLSDENIQKVIKKRRVENESQKVCKTC